MPARQTIAKCGLGGRFGRRLPQKVGFWIRGNSPIYFGERRSSFDSSIRKSSTSFLPCKLRSPFGWKTVCREPNSQRFAVAAYLPTPALDLLTASRGNDIIVVGFVYHFERATITFSEGSDGAELNTPDAHRPRRNIYSSVEVGCGKAYLTLK